MTKNMTNLDRVLCSILVAPVAIAAAFAVGAGSIGATVLATSAIGFCPLYTLLGIDTRGRTPLPH